MIVLMKKRFIFTVGILCVLGILAFGIWVVTLMDKPAAAPSEFAKSNIIVLDAGHGGEDGGAVSSAGVPESIINLQLARKIQLIFCFTGHDTVMTREGEGAVYSNDAETLREKKVSDLNNRVNLVNSHPNSFLISIHQNSLPGKKSVHGAQVFYNGIQPAQRTAESVQRALNAAVNSGNEKNAKQIDSSIYLTKNIQRPGILVESGFMSNDSEALKLQTDAHQMRISAAVVAGYLSDKTAGETQ